MTNPQAPVQYAQIKNYTKPDETRKFDKGQIDNLTVNGVTFGRATFQPGWKWSTCVKPLAKTVSCEIPHTQYVISGHLHVVMDDGTEMEFQAGNVGFLPPGHDAWVVGNEPFVAINVTGMKDYAKRK